MRTLIVAAVAAMGMTGIALADEAKGPVVMTDAQMDLVVAGDLSLPNGNIVFPDFDNPAPGPVHPALPNFEGGKRNARADGAPAGDKLLGVFGPWSTHFGGHSVVFCTGC